MEDYWMTTNKKNTENFSNTRLKEPISIDSLAENLMEDLFNDIDRALNGGSRLPAEITRPEIVSLTPIKIPQIVLSEEKTLSHDAEKEEKVKMQLLMSRRSSSRVEVLKKTQEERDRQLALQVPALLLTLSFFSFYFVCCFLWLSSCMLRTHAVG